MPTRVDDLRVGMWVAVTATEEDVGPAMGFGTFGFGRGKPSLAPEVDGKPLKIVAMSLPFVCVTDGYHRHALDVRTVVFQKLSPRYVKSLLGRALYTDEHGMYAVADPNARKRRQRQEKARRAKDERACPNEAPADDVPF